MHYKNIVMEMNSKKNSIDNSKANSFVVSNNNLNEELTRLRNEASDKEHLIQKLSDEITIMRNKVSNNHISISKPTILTPKTSRINQDPNNTNSRLTKRNNSNPPKSERKEKEDKPTNPIYNATREMIKKDKLKAETSPKDKEILNEDNDHLSFMFESLCRIFKTRNYNEIILKAEGMQNDEGMNSDQVKFQNKTRDLIQNSIPEDLTRRDDGSVRIIFKMIVKIVDNYADMKKHIKVLKQQVNSNLTQTKDS